MDAPEQTQALSKVHHELLEMTGGLREDKEGLQERKKPK